jgi:hypothetical protein
MMIKIKRLILPLAFVMLTGFGVLLTAALGFHWYFTGGKPGQPIAFSHKLHIGNVGLECSDCHQYADRSPHAGVPAVSVCAECHEEVAADRPEVMKLMAFWKDKEPVPWNKVHSLGWHAVFTHKRHVKAAVDCSYCHGQVKAMGTVRQVRSLDMGWCVSCHRANNAPTDCWICHK